LIYGPNLFKTSCDLLTTLALLFYATGRLPVYPNLRRP